MSQVESFILSRRALLAGSLTAYLSRKPRQAVAQGVPDNLPVDLDGVFRILDYRLFPDAQANRFIVEIENTTKHPFDTPSVGVVLTKLDSAQSFGWATPVSPVIHPHSTECLVGIAPSILVDDSDWGTPKWLKCGNTQSSYAEQLEDWDIELSARIEILGPDHARTVVEVTNNSDLRPVGLVIRGLVRDHSGRICGTTVAASLDELDPGSSQDLTINVVPNLDYSANPFNLLKSASGMSVTFSLQPSSSAINSGCRSVMPWNR